MSNCIKRRMVWGPLVVGVMASFVICWHLHGISPSSSYGSRVPVYMTWAAIGAGVVGTSGVAWIRACIARHPRLECVGGGHDLRGRGAPSALRHTEAPVRGSSPRGHWILLPGVLLLLGSAGCAAYSALLFALWMGGAFA